jgi:hypothetical protein
MTRRCGGAYNWAMRRAVVLAMMLAAVAIPASADPIVLQTGAVPLVNILLKSGSITIRTWNRDAVQIEGPAGVGAQHLDPDLVARRIPHQYPAWAQTVKTARGDASLPAEVWVLPQLSAGPHDAVVIRGDGDTVVTVPTGTAFVLARAFGKDGIDLGGYRNGAFFLTTRAGTISMHDVSGTGFAQTARGPILAVDSSFERLRARNGIGQIFFSNCASQQIEVTSVFGSIVYDNGTFAPGLARFESTGGDVALGIGGNAQIGAHTGTGTVATEFAGRANVSGHGGDARATVGNGGPAVTASSGSGTILLYDGSLRDHASLAQRAPSLRRLFGNPRARRGAKPLRRV